LENERTNETKELRACEIGTPPAVRMPEKTILVVGATRSGKTTFINGVVNYLYNVQWNDNFRFKIVTDEGALKAKLTAKLNILPLIRCTMWKDLLFLTP
jgi:Tfp pilus assembly pilus retraction ATPase PilT